MSPTYHPPSVRQISKIYPAPRLKQNPFIVHRLRAVKTPLSKTEQKVGFAILLYALIAICVLWIPKFSEHLAKGVKSDPKLYLAEGVALIIIAALSIWRKNRILAGGFTILVAFGPWGSLIVFALPMLAFGSFTLFKKDPEVMKRRREEIARKRQEKSTKPTATGADGRALPQASKRYTPPAKSNSRSRTKK